MNSEVQNFIKAYESGKTPKTGCASTWLDEIGKPGDSFYNLNGLTFDEETNILRLKLNEMIVVEIYKPTGILVAQNNITVRDAEKVLWKGKSIEFEYVKHNGQIKPKAIRGNKVFKVSENDNAFEFYTW